MVGDWNGERKIGEEFQPQKRVFFEWMIMTVLCRVRADGRHGSIRLEVRDLDRMTAPGKGKSIKGFFSAVVLHRQVIVTGNS